MVRKVWEDLIERGGRVVRKKRKFLQIEENL